jgi:hypothetical protein
MSQFTDAVKTMLDAWRDWRDRAVIYQWTDAFRAALNTGVEAFEVAYDAEAAELSWELSTAFDTLRREWTALKGLLAARYADEKGNLPAMRIGDQFDIPPPERIYATPTFWAALESVEDEYRKLPDNKYWPNPAEQIVKDAALPSMSRQQIAKMYGFVTGNDDPDTRKAAEVLDDPKAYFAAHPEWKWPGQKRAAVNKVVDEQRFHNERQRWLAKKEAARRELEIFDNDALKQACCQAGVARIVPENIEELLGLPHITSAQICRMKKITPEELESYCNERGIVSPPSAIAFPLNENVILR